MKPLIVANWKMNPESLAEARRLFEDVGKRIGNLRRAEMVVCPPFVFLSGIRHLVSNIKFGAQDCFWEKKGAFTGEISAPMLKNLDVEYVVVGHSERRKYFNETDAIINKKLKAVLKAGLKPILCVGETAEQRRDGETNQIIQNQLIKDLEGIKNLKPSTKSKLGAGLVPHRNEVSGAGFKIKNLAIAYEPVWAIGTGNPCRVKDANGALVFIQKVLAKIYNRKMTEDIRIIYGGSVNSQNAGGYIKKAKMRGLLVGGASLDPQEFVKIIKACEA